MADTKINSRSPWLWIPTVYFAEGMPNALVATVSVMFYNDLGVSNGATAFFTSLLYLPWVIKPLWSPVVDVLKTRRQWIWAMQLLLGAGLAGVALMVPAPHFFQLTLACFWLLSFSSATHDIAADGFYMLATTEREQAFFVGIRSTFYRISMVSGQGLLVILAGIIQSRTGLPAVNLQIEAKTGVSVAQQIDAEAFATTTTSDNYLRLKASATRIEINPEPQKKTEIDALV